MSDEIVIGGLPVPPSLLSLIRSGRWVSPGDEILLDIFNEEPVQPCFYGEAMLIGENRAWHTDPEIAGPPQPLVEGSLGIFAERSLVIADLGPSMPIVLDYRESLTSPRVLYLRGLAWVLIATTFEELARRLFPQQEA
ncbi:hypothetical protein ABZ848_24560 [Streptomyces sp. NPDC047081]|uniref:hypothetical protein n=1 Tax=Streptomyces sp. NPDC047081 TaxID=3154706 RepID=UPI0033FD315E